MIDYRFTSRLQYIGGGLNVQMSAWPVEEAAGWWVPATGSATCVAAYQAKGAASLAASYVNLANPGTYDAAPGTAPTFNAATGWTFDGSSTYLTTGIVPSTGWSMIVRFAGGSGEGRHTAGCEQTGFFFYAQPRRSVVGDDRVYGQENRWLATGVRVADGVMAIANQVGYYNGSSDGAIPNVVTLTTNTQSIFLGGINLNGSVSTGTIWNGSIQAVAIYSTALDATQVAEITTAMNAL